jgi:hypothetical protein
MGKREIPSNLWGLNLSPENSIYDGRLKSSWTHLNTPSRNFVEVWWRSLFRSTSLGKRCTSWQRSTHFSKTCCRPLISSKFLTSELPFHGWKSQEIAWAGWDLDCMTDVLMGSHRSTFSKPNTAFNSDLAPCDFWAFPTMKRELRSKKFRSNQRPASRFREMGGAL